MGRGYDAIPRGGGGEGQGHYRYMREDGFSTLSVSFPCRWQPLELGRVKLIALEIKQEGEGGEGREKGGGTNVLTLSN